MTPQDITIHTIVEAELTPFGAHVLAEYIEAQSPPDRISKGDRDTRPPMQRSVGMPLWELLKVFGPHTVSSAKLPFEDLSFLRSESKAERSAREAERICVAAQNELRKLAVALGIADDYKAPEQVSVAVRQFIIARPPRVPNAPGLWWLGDDVVRVTAVEVDGELSVRIRGRWKPVNAEQPWRGRAIVDARVPKPEADEDVPF